MKHTLYCLLLVCPLLFPMGCAHGQATESTPPKNTFTLWQLPNQTRTQMMSYVLRTAHGKVIVIDGGTAGDAPYLRNFLKELAAPIDCWFITHPHDDHYDALREILKAPDGLSIGDIYASMPDANWINEVADNADKAAYAAFQATLEQTKRSLIEVTLGQEFLVDGLRIEVLGVKNPEIRRNPINNSCMVLRISDPHKSVLFLADSGFEAGEKLLQGPYAGRLHADYVQMAHHGQNGVGEDVYKKAAPAYCLWPTPKWLWDNDPGTGKDTGHWKTLQVREWMDRLHVKKHYVMMDGLQRID